MILDLDNYVSIYKQDVSRSKDILENIEIRNNFE